MSKIFVLDHDRFIKYQGKELGILTDNSPVSALLAKGADKSAFSANQRVSWIDSNGIAFKHPLQFFSKADEAFIIEKLSECPVLYKIALQSSLIL